MNWWGGHHSIDVSLYATFGKSAGLTAVFCYCNEFVMCLTWILICWCFGFCFFFVKLRICKSVVSLVGCYIIKRDHNWFASLTTMNCNCWRSLFTEGNMCNIFVCLSWNPMWIWSIYSESFSRFISATVGASIWLVVAGSLSNHNLDNIVSDMMFNPRNPFIYYRSWGGVLSPNKT